MDFILFMLRVAFKVLAIVGGFMVLRYVLKNGSQTMRDVLDTISMMAKATGHWIRKNCIRYLIREEQEAKKAKGINVDHADQDDFEQAMIDHETLTL